MFKTWNGTGKNAEVTGDGGGKEIHVGETLGKDYALIYGPTYGAVEELRYADFSDYTSIEIEGDEGLVLRFLYNKPTDSGANETYYTIPEGGKLIIDIHSFEYYHLNSLKSGWNGANGKKITKITLVKELVGDLVEGFTELTQSMCHSWNSPDANATITGNAGDYNLNVSRKGGDVVYGGNIPWSVYADVSNYKKLVVTGTPGSNIRIVYNREKTEEGGDSNVFGDITQLLDEDGYTCFDLTTWGTYAHLNSIKIPYYGELPAKVYELILLDEGKEVKMAKVGDAGFSTYVPTSNVSAFKVKAYKAKYEDGSVKLTQVEAIPSGQAVVLEASAGSYALPVVASASSLDGNELLVSDGTVTGGSTIYALSNGSEGVGFYQVDSSVTIPSGKAYLVIAGLARKFIGLGDDAVTGVTTLKRAVANDNVYYDLQGRRVAQPKKGVYVRNGKKLFVK